MQRAAGVELTATCHICLKTKFADGVGHSCHYCRVRCCARCGGKVTLRSNKVIWVCILCRKKQELLSKTGQWIHKSTGQDSMLWRMESDLRGLAPPVDASLDKRPKLERAHSAAEKENQPLQRSGSALRRQYSQQEPRCYGELEGLARTHPHLVHPRQKASYGMDDAGDLAPPHPSHVPHPPHIAHPPQPPRSSSSEDDAPECVSDENEEYRERGKSACLFTTNARSRARAPTPVFSFHDTLVLFGPSLIDRTHTHNEHRLIARHPFIVIEHPSPQINVHAVAQVHKVSLTVRHYFSASCGWREAVPQGQRRRRRGRPLAVSLPPNAVHRNRTKKFRTSWFITSYVRRPLSDVIWDRLEVVVQRRAVGGGGVIGLGGSLHICVCSVGGIEGCSRLRHPHLRSATLAANNYYNLTNHSSGVYEAEAEARGPLGVGAVAAVRPAGGRSFDSATECRWRGRDDGEGSYLRSFAPDESPRPERAVYKSAYLWEDPADSRRFTERRKKTVRFDGHEGAATFPRGGRETAAPLDWAALRWESERQASQDSATKDSGIDTSSTFTSSEDSNRGDCPKFPLSWQVSAGGTRMIGHMVLRKSVVEGSSHSSAAILGLKVVGGRLGPDGTRVAVVEKVKKGSIADLEGQLRIVCESSGGPLPFHHPITSLDQPHPLTNSPSPSAHSFLHKISHSYPRGRYRTVDYSEARVSMDKRDEVLQWNGVSLAGRSAEEVAAVVADSKQDTHVELVVSRPLPAARAPAPAQPWRTHKEVYTEVLGGCDKPSVLVTSPSSPDAQARRRPRRHYSHNAAVGGRLQLKVYFDISALQLLVTVVSATGLSPRADGQSRCPYAKMFLLPDKSEKSKRRTKTLANTLEPRWNQTFIYCGIRITDIKKRTLEVTVWDLNRYGPNDFLGEVLLDLDNIVMNHEPNWYTLKPHEESLNFSRYRSEEMEGEHLSPPSTSTSRLSDSDTPSEGDLRRHHSLSSLASSSSPPPPHEQMEMESTRRSRRDMSPAGRVRAAGMTRDRGGYNGARSQSAAGGARPPRSRSKSPRRSLSPPADGAWCYTGASRRGHRAFLAASISAHPHGTLAASALAGHSTVYSILFRRVCSSSRLYCSTHCSDFLALYLFFLFFHIFHRSGPMSDERSSGGASGGDGTRLPTHAYAPRFQSRSATATPTTSPKKRQLPQIPHQGTQRTVRAQVSAELEERKWIGPHHIGATLTYRSTPQGQYTHPRPPAFDPPRGVDAL
ncbi:Regulating synaptic membrane exocytosis protein 1 [Eumeta japonica]|uniref:Regulating synaptic membrane exocytosis protein 1 n=1 Tax=Eumeta variegata TaxID=151549 RepID=A0A4C1YFQ3_EUMVA|nr:Regulating synaptic membrane exocytosis protein 1 [Eumeta japonica]